MSSANVSCWKYALIIINVHKPQVISVLCDPSVLIHTMGLKAGSCHTQSFIIDGGASAEVHWDANKDQEKEFNSELHKFIFILQDKKRQTI